MEWAKRVPHFSELPLDDQVILLRAGEWPGPRARGVREGLGAPPGGNGAVLLLGGAPAPALPPLALAPPAPQKRVFSLGSLLVAFKEVKGCRGAVEREGERVWRGCPWGLFCLLPALRLQPLS